MTRLTALVFIAFAMFSIMTKDFATAQSTDNIRVRIPFDFFVGEEKLAAGEYTIGRLNAGAPGGALLIRGTEGRRKVVLTQRTEANEAHRESALTFLCHGGEYFLREFWRGGEKDGRRLPASDFSLQNRVAGEERLVVVTLVNKSHEN